ncbi:MAG: hypothetical protein RSG23_01410 [Gordonibacter sp.]|uniref:hypothetical protein n=1 Tax=Gordonibacter sp. TaxID=1968902 RepID=UPI002FCB8C06
MGWHLSTEVIAFIIVFIITVHSYRSHAVLSNKNRVFRLRLVTTLGAIGTNLASTIMIAHAPTDLLPLTWLITMLYFVLTPLLGTVYLHYAVAVVSEACTISRRLVLVASVPYVAYLVITVANIPTGCLFYFDGAGAYHQGPLIFSTYLVFYFYCFKSIGSMILSERVETVEQRAFLMERGCEFLQGYLLSRPLPADRAAPVIAASEQARR